MRVIRISELFYFFDCDNTIQCEHLFSFSTHYFLTLSRENKLVSNFYEHSAKPKMLAINEEQTCRFIEIHEAGI